MEIEHVVMGNNKARLQGAVFTQNAIKVMKTLETATIPTKANPTDVGFDLYAAEDVLLLPFVPTLVQTGIAIELPSNIEAQIRPRSGLALKHGVTVLNSPGTIDPSYRKPIGVILQLATTAFLPPKNSLLYRYFDNDGSYSITNTTTGVTEHITPDQFILGMPKPEYSGHLIRVGDRIAQMVFAPIVQTELEEVSEIETTMRGGFGSTGA